jgi:hypothetical protein
MTRVVLTIVVAGFVGVGLSGAPVPVPPTPNRPGGHLGAPKFPC